MATHDSMIVDRTKLVSPIGAFVGSVLLIAGIYNFIDRVLFLAESRSLSAGVVSV